MDPVRCGGAPWGPRRWSGAPREGPCADAIVMEESNTFIIHPLSNMCRVGADHEMAHRFGWCPAEAAFFA